MISEIPNAQIFEEEQVALYPDESERVDEVFTFAINAARSEFGPHSEPVEQVLVLLSGSKDPA